MLVSHFLIQLKETAKRQLPSATSNLQAQLIKTGLINAQPLANSLLDAYGKCGSLEEARYLFEEMRRRDHFSWATMLTAYNLAGIPDKALLVFPAMLVVDGLRPDHFVYASLIKACAGLCTARLGKRVHANLVVSSFWEDDVVKSSLVDMYAKSGLLEMARAVFDTVLVKSDACWTSMISGYARNGLKGEALELFQMVPSRNLYSWTALISGLVQSGNAVAGINMFIEMRRESIATMDSLVLSSIVGACANLALLEMGKQVHGLAISLGFMSHLFINNSLVDMYSKCSDILAAKDIFRSTIHRDVVSWTCMIVGAAQHGRGDEALDLYDEMVLDGVKPNEVTFVGLIYACSHAGLVSKGRELFRTMVEECGISPSLQHFTCLLDLFSRSGHLDEAEKLVETMPFVPDEPTWAALLSACTRHGKKLMALRVADHVFNLNPVDPSTLILLSNVYANAGRWERVSAVRQTMSVLEIRREPGFSCINLGNENRVFYSGETSHPMADEISGLLEELDKEMRRRGYVPDTSCVLHDMEEQEKERQLFLHSERLAVAYGLLMSVPGAVIRIVKNLRVCGDCHTVMKLLSAILQREIIVRDVTRYHHFKEGRCSCSNFW